MCSKITLSIHIRVPMTTVWKLWTDSEHIRVWNNVDESWHTPYIKLDLKPGGEFFYRMESRDGQQGFDYKGTFGEIVHHQRIEYNLTDGRKTLNTFRVDGDATQLTETFVAERETPIDEQENFCSRILQSFKNYAESIWNSKDESSQRMSSQSG